MTTAVIHVPHASTNIPDDIRDTLVLSDADLQRELLLMTDRYTDEIFSVPAELAATISFPVSRLVIDPERFIDDDEEPMAARGMGAVYTRTSAGASLRGQLTPEHRAALLAKYYEPHHLRLTRATEHALNNHGRCLIVDAHSFPSKPLPHEPDQTPDRCDICIGTDDYHTPDWLAATAVNLFRQLRFRVDVNRPFSGALVPSTFFECEPRVYSIMIEVNRSQYMNEMTGEKSERFEHCAASVQQTMTAIIEQTIKSGI